MGLLAPHRGQSQDIGLEVQHFSCRDGAIGLEWDRLHLVSRCTAEFSQAMALIKWEPLRDIEDMFERYSRSLGAPFFRPSDFARPSEFMANGEWSPRVDISENDGAFLIKAEIPGVCKENVKVTLEKGCAFIASSAPMAISPATSPCQTTWIANT